MSPVSPSDEFQGVRSGLTMPRAGSPSRSAWRRWGRWAVTGLAVLLLAAGLIAVVQPLWAYDRLATSFPAIIWRVRVEAPLVALTFDDGPAPDHTPRLLDILAAHDAHATFFLIGDRAEAYPSTVAQIRAAGHEIGNHYSGLSHVTGLSGGEFREGLLRTERALQLETEPKLFRPPGGRIRVAQIRVLGENGYRCVLGSAYPFDGAHPPVPYIEWLLTKNLAPGVIVILHDGIADPSNAFAALPAVLEAGGKRGFKFVTVGALLEAAGE